MRADQPEALIYEPLRNGAMRLVGVEFIELKDVWDSLGNGGGKQPVLKDTFAEPGDRTESLHRCRHSMSCMSGLGKITRTGASPIGTRRCHATSSPRQAARQLNLLHWHPPRRLSKRVPFSGGRFRRSSGQGRSTRA